MEQKLIELNNLNQKIKLIRDNHENNLIILGFEIWKPTVENYEISNLGNCRRKMKNGNYIEIKGSILNRGQGYKYFQLNRNNKRINYFFHHLVAQHFISERPKGLVIDHINRNSFDNRLENLRYISQQENCKNTNRYREDIKTTDNKERMRIFIHESALKSGKCKSIRYSKYNKIDRSNKICECGGKYLYKHRTDHIKTDKHKAYILDK